MRTAAIRRLAIRSIEKRVHPNRCILLRLRQWSAVQIVLGHDQMPHPVRRLDQAEAPIRISFIRSIRSEPLRKDLLLRREAAPISRSHHILWLRRGQELIPIQRLGFALWSCIFLIPGVTCILGFISDKDPTVWIAIPLLLLGAGCLYVGGRGLIVALTAPHKARGTTR